jgi:hypothetical protein
MIRIDLSLLNGLWRLAQLRVAALFVSEGTRAACLPSRIYLAFLITGTRRRPLNGRKPRAMPTRAKSADVDEEASSNAFEQMCGC